MKNLMIIVTSAFVCTSVGSAALACDSSSGIGCGASYNHHKPGDKEYDLDKKSNLNGLPYFTESGGEQTKRHLNNSGVATTSTDSIRNHVEDVELPAIEEAGKKGNYKKALATQKEAVKEMQLAIDMDEAPSSGKAADLAREKLAEDMEIYGEVLDADMPSNCPAKDCHSE